MVRAGCRQHSIYVHGTVRAAASGQCPLTGNEGLCLNYAAFCPTGDLLQAYSSVKLAMSFGWVSPKISLCSPLPVPLGIYIHLGLCSGPPCKHLQFATEQMPSIRFWILHACKNTRNAARQDIQASTSHCCAPHTLFPVVVLKKNGTPPHSSAPPTSRYLRIIMSCNCEDCGPSTAHQHRIERARSRNCKSKCYTKRSDLAAFAASYHVSKRVKRWPRRASRHSTSGCTRFVKLQPSKRMVSKGTPCTPAGTPHAADSLPVSPLSRHLRRKKVGGRSRGACPGSAAAAPRLLPSPAHNELTSGRTHCTVDVFTWNRLLGALTAASVLILSCSRSNSPSRGVDMLGTRQTFFKTGKKRRSA